MQRLLKFLGLTGILLILGCLIVPRVHQWQLNSELVSAAKQGDRERALMLIEADASPSSRDSDGVGVIHYASFTGLRDVVTVLLKRGVDPNLPDSAGRSPLVWAVLGSFGEESDTVRVLLLAGARPEQSDGAGKTALDYARTSRGAWAKRELSKVRE